LPLPAGWDRQEPEVPIGRVQRYVLVEAHAGWWNKFQNDRRYIKGEETMCWLAAHDQVEKNRSVKKSLLEKKGTLCEQSFEKSTIEEVFCFLVCYDVT
jgi:hypothetical protein